MTFELGYQFEDNGKHRHDYNEEQWRQLGKKISKPRMGFDVVSDRRKDFGESRQIAQSCDEANWDRPEEHEEHAKAQPEQSTELLPCMAQSNVAPVEIFRPWRQAQRPSSQRR